MGELTLSLFGDITQESVTPVLHQLIRHRIGDPVVLFISSDGGDMFPGLALVDVIQQHESTTVGIGLVGSSALTIFLAGKKRYIGANSRLLLHQSRWSPGCELSEAEAKDYSREMSAVNSQLKAYYCSRSGISKTRMQKLFYQDTYMTPSDAVACGLATNIWCGQGIGSSQEKPVGFRLEDGADHDDSETGEQ